MVMMRIAERIAEMVIKYFENFDEFCEWIEKMHRAGVLEEVKIKKDSKLVAMKGRVGGGFCKSTDPVNVFVTLSLILFGPYWIYLPDAKRAFEYVKKWWREKVKRKEPLHSEDLGEGSKGRRKKRAEKNIFPL